MHPGALSPPEDLPTSGRPLVNLSLAWNYHFGQDHPAGYHVFNLFLHVLSAWLLLAIVRRILCLDYFAGRFDNSSGPLAFAAALLWAVHPLQTETVEYITQRTELMVGFFYLSTFYCSLRHWAAQSAAARNIWCGLAALACLAGMASKEVMVTAPVIVLLFQRTIVTGSFRPALTKSWPLYLGLCLGWALLAYLNFSAPRASSAGFHLGVPAYVWWFTQAKVLMMYLKLAIWPWPLSIHYQIPYLETLRAAWPWLAAVAAWVAATLILLWQRSAIGFASVWVLIILSPTLVVPILTEVAAERRMYLPLAGLTTLLVVAGYALLRQTAVVRRGNAAGKKTRWPEALAIAVCAMIFVALGLASTRRLAIYDDEQALWQDNLLHQPDDPISYYNLGHTLLKADQPQRAIEALQHAVRLRPNFAEAHNTLGLALCAPTGFKKASNSSRSP